LLYGDRSASAAIEIFKLNSTEHPLSSNTFDSLGEAYQVNGEKDRAIVSYVVAVMLDPSNGHAREMLRKLQQPRHWVQWSICIICIAGALVFAIIAVRRRKIAKASGPSKA
jgi:predicted Zn-dependent protease